MPNSLAVLDLVSTTKGMLPPRMTTTQMNAISSPPEGLAIYNTSNHAPEFYNGSSWLLYGFQSPMTTLGDIMYENSTPAAARLAGNTTSTKNFLTQTGTGSVSAAPSWGTISAGDVPTLNQNTSGTAANITASSNTTLTSLSNLVTVGTIGTGTWQGTAVATTYGGLGGNFGSSTGALSISSGTVSAGTLGVANGGTGDASVTAYAPIAGGTTTTGAFQSLSSGMSNTGYVLTSTGTSSVPTWQAVTPSFSGLTQYGSMYASSTSAIASTAAGATGTILEGQGNAAAPLFTATPTATSIGLNTGSSGGVVSNSSGTLEIGYDANTTTLVLGAPTATKIGIGMTAPQATIHFGASNGNSNVTSGTVGANALVLGKMNTSNNLGQYAVILGCEGSGCTASGQSSYAMGDASRAEASYATAIGDGALAQSLASVAIGDAAQVDSSQAHGVAIGYNALVSGDAGTGLGYGVSVGGFGQTVVGAYNIKSGTGGSRQTTDEAFIVGNGTSGARSNAFSVNNNGTTKFWGTTSGYLGFLPAAATTSYTLNWPAAVAGGSNYSLVSDSSGNLSWSSASVLPNTALGGLIVGSGTNTYVNTAIGTTGQVLAVSSGTAGWATVPGNTAILKGPTVQSFTSTGSQTGWLFNVTAWTGTIVAGDTYTNNGHTFTALAATQTNGSGQTLWMSGAGSLSGTTLTKGTSASGPATITFTNSGSNVLNPQAIATYTTPSGPAPISLKIKIVGGGGAGGHEGGSAVAGGTGLASAFGPLLGICTGGINGAALTSTTTQLGGSGGTCTITSPAIQILSLAGGVGGGNGNSAGFGPMGGANPLGGAGPGGPEGSGVSAGVGTANTGAGGGGGGPNIGSTATGPGGGAGGYAEICINSPGGTYYYLVGAGGSAGTNSGGGIGGAGGSGLVVVEEQYQ